jgi:hypothetical protein
MSDETLALPDYDHLSLGDLEGRIRSLDADALSGLISYEEDHGSRLPVLQLLRSRLDSVRDGAALSDGSATAPSPTAAAAPAGGSKVGPETSGPPLNPPSHGDPTNPAQPRS